MGVVHWLFHVNDLVPHEVAPRRARKLRAVAIAALIAAFPGVFIAYQQERLQPFADRLTEHIAEAADWNLAGERSVETGFGFGRLAAVVGHRSRPLSVFEASCDDARKRDSGLTRQ